MMDGWLSNRNEPENRIIQRGTFFPPIESAPFFRQYRPPAELPAETVIAHLEMAVIQVGRQLDRWRLEQTAATLAEVPAETVNGRSELLALWERAVYCEAKAEVLKETLTADRRKAAENNAKTGEETEEKYREFSADAIALIVGDDRVHVGSI